MTDLEVLIHEYGVAVLCEGKENLPRQIKRILEAARATPADHSTTAKPSTEQDWTKLDGAVAFSLIERHAEDWADAGLMMEAWRAARSMDAENMRNRMIEECVEICERVIIEEGHSATGHGAYICRRAIRALKSQQDAAIESQRSGDGS